MDQRDFSTPDSKAFLEGVIATRELERRKPRVCDSSAEAQAFDHLKIALAGSPRAVLQKLSEVMLDLCHAQSAGVSILEESDGRRVFRWHAVAGAWRNLLWNTLPREFSPCGTVLDRQTTLLMIDPEVFFTPLANISPRVTEALLVPFSMEGKIVGTVWVVAHDPTRHFDREDRRIITGLTRFAQIGHAKLQSLRPEDIRDLTIMRLTGEPEIEGPEQEES